MAISCSCHAVPCANSDARQRQTKRAAPSLQASVLSRRTIIYSATLAGLLQAPQLYLGPALAKPPPPTNTEADDATSPYIQDLLAKSKEKKEERALALLKDYNRRNFKDYFQFEAGGNSKRGLSEETLKQIQQWLKDNP